MVTRGWSDVAYNFAVGREVNADGTAKTYELRGDMVAGGHTSGYNHTSMAVCFLIGEGETPTPAMLRAAHQLMQDVRPSDLVRSHRDVGTTACPGDDIAAEVADPQHKDIFMTPQEAVPHLQAMYRGLLGRAADSAGLEFWARQVSMGEATLESVAWEFMRVRLAADDARLSAVIAKVDQGTAGGPTAEKVAEQAYRLFLDDLTALR